MQAWKGQNTAGCHALGCNEMPTSGTTGRPPPAEKPGTTVVGIWVFRLSDATRMTSASDLIHQHAHRASKLLPVPCSVTVTFRCLFKGWKTRDRFQLPCRSYAIYSPGLARLHRQRLVSVLQKAHRQPCGVIGFTIRFQHILHPPDATGHHLIYAPLLLRPRVEVTPFAPFCRRWTPSPQVLPMCRPEVASSGVLAPGVEHGRPELSDRPPVFCPVSTGHSDESARRERSPGPLRQNVSGC